MKNIKMWFRLVWIVMAFGASGTIQSRASDFAFVRSGDRLEIYMGNKEKEVVRSAYAMFDADYRGIFERSTVLSDSPADAHVFVGTVGLEKTQQWATKLGVNTDGLKGLWEAFRIEVVRWKDRAVLVVLGSDARGTAYGLLELSRLIGVSPWCWWADVVPTPKEQYMLPNRYVNEQKPSVQYRGIFINDEDWGLMPWSSKSFEPSPVPGQIGPYTYEQVFQLLLRLRANTIWPAMHECTVPFYFTEGNKEMADKYGIVLGTSHCEPLMRNNAGEWDRNKYGEYNYITNQTVISNYWQERLKEAGIYENFYTIGMRGVHDGKMEGAKTLDEQTALMQRAIAHQRELLSRYVNKDVASIPQAFVPYKEVLDVYNNGLHVPDDVTLVWCDDNYGYITRLSNDTEQKRRGGSGVYYHASYWGRPHDYLWLSTTSPAQIYTEMKRAWDYGTQKMWILNVGDIKPAEYEMEFFLDLAWDINMVTPESVFSHLQQWLIREFGATPEPVLTRIKKEYYRLATLRKPEFMGWSRVEESGVTGGKTPVVDTGFNPYMFGDEVQRRINDYQQLSDEVHRVAALIPVHRRDAFFQLIEYPVCAAAAMNHKLLYAQKARLAARTLSVEANQYAEASRKAYLSIQRLTDTYNHSIAGAKWSRIMDMKPRNLPVFQECDLPGYIGEVDDLFIDSLQQIRKAIADSLSSDAPCLAWNANTYDKKTSSAIAQPVEGLGHSQYAVVVPYSESLLYDIDIEREGNCVVHVATVPNHPVHGGELRYEISIDGGESQIVSYKTVGRSEQWKLNVLRNQALTTTRHRITKGKHTLRIKALDEGVIVDQLMLDFDPDRIFYEIPVSTFHTPISSAGL